MLLFGEGVLALLLVTVDLREIKELFAFGQAFLVSLLNLGRFLLSLNPMYVWDALTQVIVLMNFQFFMTYPRDMNK